jgi:ABC-type multidrug transport system ATPase subunit
MNKTHIRMQSITIGYNRREPLLKNVDLTINAGEIVAITGPSGIGKTTLLRTIAGLVPPLSGNMQICGSKNRPPRGELGYIPQRLGLVRHGSVRHNVLMGALTGHASRWFPFSKKASNLTNESIIAMGIEDKMNTPVRRLSGGQQRRVATARTLAQQPSLILADEFLSELDKETMENVMQTMIQYVRINNSALLVVEHDLDRAKEMADRLFVIEDLELIEVIL